MYELMFQTYNWEICNCTTQAGCNSSVENGKTSSNVNTTIAEYVQEEAEEEKKMYNVKKRKCKM